MPSKKFKPLHVSSSLKELNEKAEKVDVKINNVLQCNQYCTAVANIFKKAEAQRVDGDEETAYFLYMRYFHIFDKIKSSYCYKKAPTKFNAYLKAANPGKAIAEAEELSKSLVKRYTQLKEDEAKDAPILPDVPDNLHALPKSNSLDKQEKNSGKGSSSSTSPSKDVPVNGKPNGDNQIVPNDIGLDCLINGVHKANGAPPSPRIEVMDVYALLNSDAKDSLLVLDIRSSEDFIASRIKKVQSINIPPTLLLPGASVNSIDRRLSKSVFDIWVTRTQKDHIIIVDHDASSDEASATGPATILKDIIYKWDSQNILKCEPKILIGGFENWHLLFPSLCTDPMYSRKTSPKSVPDPLALISNLTYPSMFGEKSPPVTTSSASSETSSKSTITSRPSAIPSLPESGTTPLPIPTPSSSKPHVSTAKDVTVSPSAPGGGIAAQNASAASTTKLANIVGNEQPTPHERISNGVGSKRVSFENDIDSSLKPAASHVLPVPPAGFVKDFPPSPPLQGITKTVTPANKPVHSASSINRIRDDDSRIMPTAGKPLEPIPKKDMHLPPVDSSPSPNNGKIDNTPKRRTHPEGSEVLKGNLAAAKPVGSHKNVPNVGPLLLPKTPPLPGSVVPATVKNTPNVDAGTSLPQPNIDINDPRKITVSAYTGPTLNSSVVAPKPTDTRSSPVAGITPPTAKVVPAKQDQPTALPTTPGLPYGWEEANANGKTFYKNHNTKETFWHLPSHVLRQSPDTDKKQPVPQALTPHKPPTVPSQLEDLKTVQHKPPAGGINPVQSNEPVPSMKSVAAQDNNAGKFNQHLAFPSEENPMSSMKRSLSSPNLAALNNGAAVSPRPIIDRSVKPQDQPRMSIDRSKNPISSSRLQNLVPVHGSKGQYLTGLKNLGNTCYMNSIVQCLSATVPFSRYMRTGQFEPDLNPRSRSRRPGYVSREMAFLLKVLWSGQYRSVSPYDFRHMIGELRGEFATSQQQDAHELLIILLEDLHKDLGRNLPAPPSVDTENIPNHIAAEKAWQCDVHNKNRVLVDLMQGQFCSTVCCLTCNYRSVTFESFDFLQLELPSRTSCTLEDCLRSFTKIEKITGKDSWKCSKCKQYREATKSIEICRLPPVLIIQLKRFSSDGIWHNKLQTSVNFPLDSLNVPCSGLTRSAVDSSSYSLYATVNHSGSFEGGHYTAYCKLAALGKWFCFNDNTVSEIDRSSVKSAGAYLLFYTAVDFR